MSAGMQSRAAVVAVLVLAACQSRLRPADGSRPAPTGPRTQITSTQIANTREATAYGAVEKLHPQLLRSIRTDAELRGRIVYLDGMRLGGIEQLRNIPAVAVVEIRALSGIEATALFGTGNSTGAIVVSTRAQR